MRSHPRVVAASVAACLPLFFNQLPGAVIDQACHLLALPDNRIVALHAGWALHGRVSALQA